MAPPAPTTVSRVPSSYTLFGRENMVYISTEVPIPASLNWDVDLGTRTSLTDVHAASFDQGTNPGFGQLVFESEATAQLRVRGVVDDLDGELARVTLMYADRENPFVFDLNELEAAGADYAGALFEVVIGPSLEYNIVHLAAEEEAARKAAPPLDLSFLDR